MKKLFIIIFALLLTETSSNAYSPYMTGIVLFKDMPVTAKTVIFNVLPGSPAEQAGLRTGDEITKIYGIPITSKFIYPFTEDEIIKSIRPDDYSGKPVDLTIAPNKKVSLYRTILPSPYKEKSLYQWKKVPDLPPKFHIPENVDQYTATPDITNSEYRYLKFYKVNPYTFGIKLIELTDQQKKQLSNSDKDLYKKAVKVQKRIDKGQYWFAFNADDEYLPTYLAYYQAILKKNQTYLSPYCVVLAKLYRFNQEVNILNADELNYQMGVTSYTYGDYENAIKYLNQLPSEYIAQNEAITFIKGDLNYILGDYKSAVNFGKQIPENSLYYESALKLLGESYHRLKNYNEAYKYAEILVKKFPGYENYLIIAKSAPYDSQKLEYYYKARNILFQSYKNNQKITAVNDMIAELEQKKINNAVKNLKNFVKTPNWKEIYNGIYGSTDPRIISARQDNFFKLANNCISRYSGDNLIKCFNSIVEEEEKLNADIKYEYYDNLNHSRQQMLQYDLIRHQEEMNRQLIQQLRYQNR